MVNQKYNRYLAKILSPGVLSPLIKFGKSDYISEVISNSGFKKTFYNIDTYYTFFDILFSYLKNNYRCEYVYKNAIVNKILIGKFSLNTSTVLEEFRVYDTKADLVLLNGTSNVFEIKTEMDNFSKLSRQIEAYRNYFDKIYIVTHYSREKEMKKYLPNDIGLIILTKNFTLRTIQESESNINNIKPEYIFDSLRKNEYCSVLKNCLGFIPEVPNTMIYREAKKMFKIIPITFAHEEVVKQLKKRCLKKHLNLLGKIPKALNSFWLSSNISSANREKLVYMLNKEFNLF